MLHKDSDEARRQKARAGSEGEAKVKVLQLLYSNSKKLMLSATI